MVISSSDITQKTYKKLVLQVSLNELTFCVIDLITHKVVHTQEILFEKNKVIKVVVVPLLLLLKNFV
jgi:hypothetical protein